MAITAQRINSTLKMQFETGMDEFGSSTYKTKSFRNVRTEATTESLYEIVTKLKDLQQHPLVKVTRDDESLIETTEE
ncbi:DUF1659 domain-containing protein [Salimicrobium flavidum]|uniref:DUF1659 domain-containing protein n=1 Tax=Salimicrobium flavidum TaxID=570947 RepID=A0A1N7K1H3_9BACI|nr:DUF1659 domain-containing protein [Salimicrobium flavidum]SIS55435.1 Protein of unknown function [Salimicrobium flavidum]